MSSRNVILVAHLIKIGIPIGLFATAWNLAYELLLRTGGIGLDLVAKSITMFGLCVLGSLILGLSRVNRNDV